MAFLFGGGGSASSPDDADGLGGGSGSDLLSGREVLASYKNLVESIEYDPAAGDGAGAGGGEVAAAAAAAGGEVLGGAAGEADLVVESVLGHSGDSVAKARQGLAAFVYLVGIWCRASPEVLPDGVGGGNAAGTAERRTGRVDPTLLALAIDYAQSLVAHGCFDGVVIEFGGGGADDGGGGATDAPKRTKKAIELVAESVFLADLSSERTELSALKFLLTTGCRTMEPASYDDGGSSGGSDGNGADGDAAQVTTTMMGDAMLRGAHLLQAVRVCYHVYLKTASEPNKTTARAALRQLVANVFTRMERRNQFLEAADAAAAAASSSEVIEEDEGVEDSAKDTDTPADGAASADARESDDDGSGEEEKKKKDESVATPASATTASGGDFPSPDHRDAFLVLRSLCKLSMRNLPTGTSVGGGSASGMPASGATWDDSAAAASMSGPPSSSSGLPGVVVRPSWRRGYAGDGRRWSKSGV